MEKVQQNICHSMLRHKIESFAYLLARVLFKNTLFFSVKLKAFDVMLLFLS